MLLPELERPPLHEADRTPAAMPSHRRASAPPGTMSLRALRERGRIADFIWSSVGPAAAKLLRCSPLDLLGRRLSETVSGGPLGHPALIDRYRRVIEHGNAQSFAQVHLIDGQQDVVVHRVVRAGDGVEVSLTNLSADRRVQAWRLEHAAGNQGVLEPARRRTTQ
jgi:plasmid stabilization system protein ParE